MEVLKVKIISKIFLSFLSLLFINLGANMANTDKKVIIWDLGNTLLQPNKFGFATRIGIADFILYPLLEWRNPAEIKNIVFDVLNEIEKPQNTKYKAKSDDGTILPAVMCDWLTGEKETKEILRTADKKINELDKVGYFYSAREKRLVKKSIKAMFDPQHLANCMMPIRSGMSLLDECARRGHELFILSNWDSASFNHLAHTRQGKKLLKYFEPDHVIISGELGIIKPEPKVYTDLIKKFKLNPANCIIIDDQLDNIMSAKKCGMTGLWLENHDYRKLKKELKNLRVL